MLQKEKSVKKQDSKKVIGEATASNWEGDDDSKVVEQLEKLIGDANAGYTYYKAAYKLISEMIATCPPPDIWNKFVVANAKKEMKKANSLSGKIAKSLQKYKGSEITEKKEIAELKGIIRNYQQMTENFDPLPDTVEELLEFAQKLQEDFDKNTAEDSNRGITVFMRGEDGHPIISSHMILGNLKENLRIMTNNGDKSIATSKVSVNEMMAADVKCVEFFLRSSQDVDRDAKGNPRICERTLIKPNMGGGKDSVIARSETLPKGTVFEFTLRVRTTSPLNSIKVLSYLMEKGRNNGLGAWRGSGNRGAFVYKLDVAPNFVETFEDGWK